MIQLRLMRDDDHLAVMDLIVAAFEHDWAAVPAVREAVRSDPDYRPSRRLVAEDAAGRLVGHIAVKETAVSLGGVWLPAARLGAVCTAPDTRRTGLGRKLVAWAAEQLPEAGAVILNPAPEPYVRAFYERLGFVAAVRTSAAWRVHARRLRAGRHQVTLRAGSDSDAAALDAIYERHYGPQPGSLRRSATWWRRRLAGLPLLWSRPVPSVRVAEEGGQPVAYLLGPEDDDRRVWEWACRPGREDAARALMGEVDGGDGSFQVMIAPPDPLFGLLRAARGRDETPASVAVMVRAAERRVLVTALAELLSPRGGELAGDDQTAELRRGPVRLVCDWSRLLALCYDGRPLAEWAAAGLVRVEPGAQGPRQVAELLPTRVAGRRHTDAY